MKYIIIAISLLLSLSLLQSQMEFEEVLQLYPEGSGGTYGSQIYLNGDSIYIESTYHDQTKGFLLSSDGGDTWEDLLMREKLKLGENSPNYTAFNPYKFHFININNDDSTFSINNFDGDVVSKSKLSSYTYSSKIIFNPIDPNFIGVLRKSFNPIFNFYDDRFFYSNDYGGTWQKLEVYDIVTEYAGMSLPPYMEIRFQPNVRNSNKSLFQFVWHNHISSTYEYSVNYNFYSQQPRFYDPRVEPNFSNYSIFDEDEVVRVTDRDSLIHLNVETDEKYGYSRLDATMGWDPDSIAQNNIDRKIYQALKFERFKVNYINPDHQVVFYKHFRKVYDNDPQMSFIDQYIFQSFDAGKTWETVAQEFDIFNTIFDVFINPKDLSLWIIKEEHNAVSEDGNGRYSTLYKSKSPLTNVGEIESQINNISALFSGNSLIIDSEDLVGDAYVELFNIEGRKVLESNKQIKRGRNEINLSQNIANGLYLVQIKTGEEEQTIVKLIRSK